jgi:hypothetical protein
VVKALMSAPAEQRIGGGDDERAHARLLHLRPHLLEVRDEFGRDRVHLPVGEPRDCDSVGARLELDDLGGLLGIGLRIGVEALPALLPEATLRDEAAQDRGRREALAVALLRVLHALEDRVEAVGVGAHERRQQAAARVEPGSGHHPEVDVAVGRDALLQHEARLDEGLQRQELYELGDVGIGVAGDVRLALRVVEAISPGLGPELAVGDELLHAAGNVKAFLPVGVHEVLGDVKDRVEPEEVAEQVGADGHDSGGGDALVDLLDREALLLLLAPNLGDAGVEDAVYDEAGDLGAGDRLLADRLREGDGGRERLGRGLLALDDLDQGHDRGGIEVVEADDPVGAQRGIADLGDRQRGGVRGEDRVRGGGGVELREHVLLDLDLLGHRLDHEVDLAEAAVGGGALDAADHLIHLRLCLLVGEPAFLDQFARLALGDRARLREPSLHERVVDVLEHDGDAGGGDRLCDLPAHRPRADNRGPEYEHALRLLCCGLRERSDREAARVVNVSLMRAAHLWRQARV